MAYAKFFSYFFFGVVMKKLVFYALLIFVFIITIVPFSFAQKTPPPKAGEYGCYSFTTKTTPKMEWVLNPITNQLEMRLGVGVGSNLSPAPFNIVLNGKGLYSMSKTKGKGTYSYSPDTSKLTFTGDITFLNFVSYGLSKDGEYVINFSDRKSNVPYICALGDKLAKTNSNQPDSNQASVNKVKQNPQTIYIPSASKNNSNVVKAFEQYQLVMAGDLENFHDVAGALAYIVCLNYMAYNGKSSVPTYQVQKIYDQFVEKLLLDSNFKNGKHQLKQNILETVILDGLITREAQYSLERSTIKDVSMKMLKKYLGNSAVNLKITDNGMEF